MKKQPYPVIIGTFFGNGGRFMGINKYHVFCLSVNNSLYYVDLYLVEKTGFMVKKSTLPLVECWVILWITYFQNLEELRKHYSN